MISESSITLAMLKYAILILVLAVSVKGQQYSFPDDFRFGVATASYQVEGAWNVSDKGENIWDRLTHSTPERIADRSTGDVACDTYHKTESDVEILKNLGVDFYRFSISWSRILPTGYVGEISSDGIRYYNELIDALLANDIEPLVTMFHWDLPQSLQEIGGWPNPLISDLFTDYANILYEQFGDRVKNWITFNEPPVICGGYAGGLAPGYNQQGIGDYLCAHHLLIAHGKTYRLYNERYRSTQGGRVGITVNTRWYEPASDSEEDFEAAERAMQMIYGIYVHPIYSESGDYPAILRERVDALSAEQGYARSRLPSFTAAEVEFIRGSSDFLGLNHYTTSLCTFATYDLRPPSQWADAGVICYQSDDWVGSGSSWLKVVPWGLRKLLNWIKNEFNNPEVVITENGVSDNTGQVDDCSRVSYYNQYLEAVLQAIHVDGCNLTGYTAWSLMDNFEWLMGYTEKFGLYSVDFDNEDRPRAAKRSSYVFGNIIKTRQIDWDFTPNDFEPCEW